MKPSRSGTASPDIESRRPNLGLIAAGLVVIAFAVSFILGIRRTEEPAPLAPADSAVAVTPPNSGARVEVLNGAGKAGLARLATDQLRDAGFDVVHFGNAREVALTSAVLDRVGNSGIAVAVGQALGITMIKTAIDSTRLVDATVVIGKDWPPPRPR